jgi:hypothetical protein
MGKGNRPATCSSSGKRLRAKSWFYRNGKYYYNKRAWADEQKKLAAEAAKAKPAKAEAESAPAAAPEPAA